MKREINQLSIIKKYNNLISGYLLKIKDDLKSSINLILLDQQLAGNQHIFVLLPDLGLLCQQKKENGDAL